VVDAPVDFEVTIRHDLKNATDFKIIGHKLELIGICPACSTQAKPSCRPAF
jgi:Fe2+ or Zn2+ uptake regulation protein